MTTAFLKTLGTAAAFALAGAVAAHAAPVIVQTQSQTFQAGSTLEPTPWSTIFTFDKYSGANPLVGVELVLSGTSQTTLTFTNASPTAEATASGNAGTGLTATLATPSSLSISTFPGVTFDLTVPAESTVVFGPENGSDSNSLMLGTGDGDFSFFLGVDTFDVNMSATGFLSLFTFGGNNSHTQATSAFGTFTVNYIADDEMEIAEPGILAIFGLGLIGLGVMRRRRA